MWALGHILQADMNPVFKRLANFRKSESKEEFDIIGKERFGPTRSGWELVT
jgi:hypothetical protein